MSNKIERARLLATFIHMGQKRQDGEDYINHPKRMVEEYKNIICGGKELRVVAPALTSEQEDIICAIWLHDTIEDADRKVITNEFIYEWFGEKIWKIVIHLTHFNKIEQSYLMYMEKVIRDPIALQIKWLDMIDNTSYKIPEKQWNKYRNAIIHLISLGITVPNILCERLKINGG